MGRVKSFFDTRKFRFTFCGWGRRICGYCGYRFEPDDCITKVSYNGEAEYFHDFCLDEMDGKEALQHFGITCEEVEI